MKLLLIAPRTPWPPDDGGRAAMLSLVRSLQSEGMEIHFVAPRVKGLDARQFSTEVALHQVDYDPRSTVSGRLRYLFSSLPYTMEKFFSVRALEQIEKIMRQTQCEIIHAEQLHMVRFGLAIKQKFHLPLVLRAQNVESELVRLFRDRATNPAVRMYAHRQYLKMVRYETDMIRRCDAVLAITSEDARLLQSMATLGRCEVVPYGVDTSRFIFGHTFVPDTLLFPTNLDWPPNRDSFAFFQQSIHPKLLALRPALRTIVIGKGVHKGDAGRVHRSIELRGFLPDINEVPALASVAIVPLRVGSGIRVKILDLMAMGVVVVSTSLGMQGIDATPGEHLIVADDPDLMAQQVDQILDDPARLQRISVAARKLVQERYSSRAFGKTIADVYRSLLPDHHFPA